MYTEMYRYYIIAGMIRLVGMIGAIVMTTPYREEKKRREIKRQKISEQMRRKSKY